MLVTAGPTFEPIDPVRFIGNRSSGKQGYAIAAAAARLGARVTLVSGPSALAAPAGVAAVHVETALEMLAAVEAALPADIGIFSAAVADWRPAKMHPGKIKKGAAAPGIDLVENPDILKTVAEKTEKRPALVIGFAAETGNAVAEASKKLKSKGCDWIVANDVSPGGGVFGGDRNTVHLISAVGGAELAGDDQGRGCPAPGAGCGGMASEGRRGAIVTIVRYRVLPHGEGLPAPSYRSDLAAGLDLAAAIEEGATLSLAPGERALVPTGIALELPAGFEAQVRPRSGLAHRHGVTVLNAPGTIDADYRGEIQVILINHGKEAFSIVRGDRIAQLVIAAVAAVTLEQAENLSVTERNTGGFGSTGTR